MELIDASYPDDHYDGDLSWINFQGRWGNIQKIVSQILFPLPNFSNHIILCKLYKSSQTLCISLQHCELEPLVGECGLVEGVGGPGTDFGMNHFGDPDCI